VVQVGLAPVFSILISLHEADFASEVLQGSQTAWSVCFPVAKVRLYMGMPNGRHWLTPRSL
jgi:hypothetical protein